MLEVIIVYEVIRGDYKSVEHSCAGSPHILPHTDYNIRGRLTPNSLATSTSILQILLTIFYDTIILKNNSLNNFVALNSICLIL